MITLSAYIESENGWRQRCTVWTTGIENNGKQEIKNHILYFKVIMWR